MQTSVIIGGIIAFVLEIIFIPFIVHYIKLRKIIDDTPTSRVDSIQEGLTELKGRVVPLDKLSAPISGKECVYYDVNVMELRSNGKSSSWVTIKRDRKKTDFLLDDGSSPKAKISFTKASLEIKRDSTVSTHLFQDLPENVKQALAKMGVPTKFFVFNRNLKVEESYIEPGDEVYALGYARRIDDRENKAWFSLGKEKGYPFIISDKPEKDLVRNYTIIGIVFLALALAVIITAAILFWIYGMPVFFKGE